MPDYAKLKALLQGMLSPAAKTTAAAAKKVGPSFVERHPIATLAGAVGLPYMAAKTQEADLNRQIQLQQMAASLGKFSEDKALQKAAAFPSGLYAGLSDIGKLIQQNMLAPLGRAAMSKPGLLGMGLAAGYAVPHVIGAVSTDASKTISYRMNKALNTLEDRIKADEIAATKYLQEMTEARAKVEIDEAGKREKEQEWQAGSLARKALFSKIVREDPALGGPENKELLSQAYESMARYAPNLSTDINAVRSFLREAVTYGTGPSYQTLKNLAEAERAISGKGTKETIFTHKPGV